MLAPELEQMDGADVCRVGRTARGRSGRSRASCTVSGAASSIPACPTGTAFALRAARPGLDLRARSGHLSPGLRRRKEPDELERLRAAGREADAAVEWLGAPGRWTVAASARWRSSSRRASSPGWRRALRRLRRGLGRERGAAAPRERRRADRSSAPLLTDLGCTIAGYHSDITRMFFPRAPAAEVARGLRGRLRRARRRDRRASSPGCRAGRPTGSPAP